MHWGKSILAAALLAALCHTHLPAAEEVGYGTPSNLASLRKNATVHIGGEVRVDYAYRDSKDTHAAPHATKPRDTKLSDLAVKGANLRLRADVHPNLQAFFKLDLSSRVEDHNDQDDILEEAMLVMSAVGGQGLGFFAGKGRTPYGQDITLGMLQSYHHAANQADSSEGRIFVTDPPDARTAGGGVLSGKSLPPMRPGQMDRSFMAGASYEWHDRWKVEVAAFQPNLHRYNDRLRDRDGSRSGADIGVSGRIWWQPLEELVIQASAMAARSNDMGREYLRLDVQAGARGTNLARAISLGFDYRNGPWRVFGEYQHGWDWNFTKGYSTDTWQLGASREVVENWTVATMVEGLHITDKADVKLEDDYYKLAFNVRRSFDNGFFILAEYGHEWRRRHRDNTLWDKTRGNFFGVRVGFSF